MREALSRSRAGARLIFCLGASEIVASEISQAGPEWLRMFDAARGADHRFDSQRNAMRPRRGRDACRCGPRAVAFQSQHLLPHRDCRSDRPYRCEGTMLLMSRLADECIRAAFGMALRLTGRPRARGGRILRPRDGQARRERTQPQLRYRPDLHFRSARAGAGEHRGGADRRNHHRASFRRMLSHRYAAAPGRTQFAARGLRSMAR